MRSVAGKTVLVTGAAAGLGRLFAERAVAEGATALVLWDVDEQALKTTAAELEQGRVPVRADVVDVSSPEQVRSAAEAVLAEVGAVQVLINNAGIVRGNTYFWEHDGVDDVEAVMGVNAVGPMLVARAFLPAMIDSGSECRLVTLASSAGLVSNPRMAVYAASKWAAVGWSDSVRLELDQAGHTRVRMTTVCPTYIDTGMFAGARKMLLTPILEPGDVVDGAWSAMLRGDAFYITPWSSRLNNAIGRLLPVRLRDFYLDRAGVYHSMDDFTGHGG
jgi:NAD(P)-dependent dehydrogenase (short-subunit alcohol dehydrogenase family)